MINVEDAIAKARDAKTVLIAGPTASGKSALALRIAEQTGLPVVNADALQVFEDWRILTARPSKQDEETAKHLLYGHLPGDSAYSTGAWLRDLAPIIAAGPAIIVGGTGLNFSALLDGLAEIPSIPKSIFAQGQERLQAEGVDALARELDALTASRIDLANPMRVFRAWTVQQATGRGLADWQAQTPPPLLRPPFHAFALHAPVDWLNARIEARFDLMMEAGLMDEVAANARDFSPERPSAKAIGARELVAYYTSGGALDDVRQAVIVQTRQYAKRQRTWFRNRFSTWDWIDRTV
ncbi:MAG: tRNA (adenosine(37)-N6)-dimethylallyltransferase MiaA [Pseudomonadota bacterium]